MFEHIKKEVIPLEQFCKRLLRYFLIASLMLASGLIPGVVGYLCFSEFGLPEAGINALSLLGGLDPPYELDSHRGQIFVALYSLFIETVFFLATATMLAPLVHRLLHKMHVQSDSESKIGSE